MSADGTVALDWWFPSDDGKYVAYGTSASGSENSTLHVIETATGKLLPDTIPQARIAQVAWKKDNSGFYYGRNPKKGDVPEGDDVYYLHIFYHALGSEPKNDPLIWGEGRKKEEILVSQLPDDDDRWLLLTSYEGSAGKNQLFLQDLKAGTPPVELTSGKDFQYSGEIFRGKLYITTNEDAPALPPVRGGRGQSRPRQLEGNHSRVGRHSEGRRNRGRKNHRAVREKRQLAAQALRSRGQGAGRHRTSRHRLDRGARRANGTARKSSSDSSRSPCRLRSIRWSWPRAKLRCGTR